MTADAAVRLTDGSLGVLEVYRNDAWGTVCSSASSPADDTVCPVVCRQMGYTCVNVWFKLVAYSDVVMVSVRVSGCMSQIWPEVVH